MDDVKLSPCPFCGELPTITKHFKHEMYSFVHRCSVIGPISRDFRERAQDHADMWNTRCASDFDAQRLRADTAEADLQALRLVFENAEDCELNDAELKLAAAEQRIAELEGPLRSASEELHDFITGSLLERIDAALNQKSEGESQ